ncbi:hypothetical protein FCM35_KLT21030 [Carex littledalei]|uniref:Uncharacterized protein n=1 Tax=Carex littledalei TaxID=544730 RepID=A0A833R7A9_9POAL|nr:hypothetical protein FCM35_KLT21030 [Carex littledalei]
MELMPIPDREARSSGIENQPIIYCPTPRHVNQHTLFFNTLDQSGANLNRGGDRLETDLILSQDGAEANSVFLCESPPVRTNNPLIRDSIFVERLNSQFASSRTSSSSNSIPSVNSASFSKKPRLEAGSPSSSCGVTSSYTSSPKLRVEGFAVIVGSI